MEKIALEIEPINDHLTSAMLHNHFGAMHNLLIWQYNSQSQISQNSQKFCRKEKVISEHDDSTKPVVSQYRIRQPIYFRRSRPSFPHFDNLHGWARGCVANRSRLPLVYFGGSVWNVRAVSRSFVHNNIIRAMMLCMLVVPHI